VRGRYCAIPPPVLSSHIQVLTVLYMDICGVCLPIRQAPLNCYLISYAYVLLLKCIFIIVANFSAWSDLSAITLPEKLSMTSQV